MYLDIHSHILPRVDDGATSDTEAIKILNILENQGINAVALTPHFYPNNESTIGMFRNRIEETFAHFKSLSPDNMHMFLGTEVHYFYGISQLDDLSPLCIGNSKYMLLELPYRRISTRTEDEITELSLSRGITPILAHIERYRKFECFDRILALIDEEYALGQVNSYSFFEGGTKRFVTKLAKEGYVHLIGSDSHRPKASQIRINDALSRIEKKCGVDCADSIRQNSQKIYDALLSAEQGS